MATRHRRLAYNSPIRHVRYTYLGKPLPTSYTDSSFSLKDSSTYIIYPIVLLLDSLSISLPHNNRTYGNYISKRLNIHCSRFNSILGRRLFAKYNLKLYI